MKFSSLIILVSLLLLSTKTYCNEDYQLSCKSNNGKNSIVIEKFHERIRLSYTNPNGFADFPLLNKAPTSNDLKKIKIAKKELKSLDKEIVLEWNLEKCSIPYSDQFIIGCTGEVNFITPLKTKLKSYEFYTSHQIEKTPTFTYEKFKINLGIDSEQLHFVASFFFDPQQCSLRMPDESNQRLFTNIR